MKEDYKYKISVIVPVYNVEKYLEETIESVIAQTLGFKNIQLILVNDGSPDNSEEICLKYKEKYPESSMAELAEIISSETEKPISKSCINHRFRKIKEIIENIGG